MERKLNEAPNVPGIDAQRVDFIAVPTQDRRRAAQFYAETLGLKRNPNSTDTWIEFETDNVTLALVTPTEIGLPFEPLPFASVVLRVPDVAEARARLEAAGVEFKGETFDSGVCNGAAFRDPDGNGLMIHRRYAPYRDGREP
ncbi:MAG TPA: VOC family protein [Gaiellaceae bacterium]|jgi:catechol 2,3-dioxygenase-like lactoylglutathione lyase family enzyme|nr:VOC family protein [Gaiellaceae bacterium]